MDAQYAKEQEALSSEIAELQKSITGYEQSKKSAERFIALIDKYENFDTLTNTMLNEFVEKIVVHERDRKGSVDTTQEVEIYFHFVGRYVPPHFRIALHFADYLLYSLWNPKKEGAAFRQNDEL